MLRKGKWLDTREVASPPIAEAVHIPWPQLKRRVHELPSKDEVIRIARADETAGIAAEWLRANGRPTEIVDHFAFGALSALRLWSPDAFLEQSLAKIKPRRALDVACGSGRDAVYMASHGADVVGLDHLPDAVALGQDLGRRYLPEPHRIRWVCTDVDEYEPNEPFDLITCFYYLNRGFLRNLSAFLNPGGHFVMETFTAVHRERHGKPKSEDLVLQPGELPELLAPLVVEEVDEGWRGNRHTARVRATRCEAC